MRFFSFLYFFCFPTTVRKKKKAGNRSGFPKMKTVAVHFKWSSIIVSICAMTMQGFCPRWYSSAAKDIKVAVATFHFLCLGNDKRDVLH
jgi:hypothetical protein